MVYRAIVVSVGELVAGKYKVERELGKGGMGHVFAAVHTQLEQRVAVKVLMPELCALEEPMTRFLQEARAAVRIRSEHVARVLDVGTLDDGTPYMVMEYLEGHDLASELDVRGQLLIAQAVDYVLQASEAIAEAHSLGIVHRDLKPANLFLSRRLDGSPLIKVLDFGISKALLSGDGSPPPDLTATQSIVGSPYYMSPEQVRKPKAVDARTDIWSLGVILYELLTGRLPFVADTAMSVLAAVVSDPAPPVRRVRAEVPEGLARVVERCLEKDAEQRFRDMGEFARALEPFAPSQSVPTIQRISAIPRSMTPALRRSEEPTRLERRDASEEATVRADSGSLRAEESGGSMTKRATQAPSRRWVSAALGLALLGGIGLFIANERRARLVKPEAVEEPSIAASEIPRPALAAARRATPLPAATSAAPALPAASGSARAPLPLASAELPAPVPKAAPRPSRATPRIRTVSRSSAPPGHPAQPVIDPLDGRR